MKVRYLFLFLLLVCSAGLALPVKPDVDVVSNTPSEVRLRINISDIIQTQVKTERGMFTELTLPEYSYSDEVGRPQLPMIREYIEIPQDADVRVEARVIASRRIDLKYRLVPKQPSVCKTGAPPPFAFDEKAYAVDGVYPEELARIEGIVQVRNHRLAVLSVNPVLYNAARNEIILHSGLEVVIRLAGGNLARTQSLHQDYFSQPFEDVLSGVVKNYRRPELLGPPLPIGYLIIVPDAWYNNVQPLAQWRRKKGYRVTVTRISQIGGGDTTRVRTYIQSQYNTAPVRPTFVVLVGDAADIQPYSGSAIGGRPTDLYYSTMAGSDYFPDLYLGRYSFANAGQLDTFVLKVLKYEKSNWTQPDSFCKKAYFIASNDGGSHQIAESTHRYSMRHLRTYGVTCDSLWLYGNTGTPVDVAINNGRAWVMYSGHGDWDRWADNGYTVANVHAQNNPDKNPLVGTFACLSGDFTYPECFSEAWIRNGFKSAIGSLASATYSYWDGDDWLERGMFKTTLDSATEWTMGAVNRGKMWVHVYNSSNSLYYHQTYNLLGDPSIEIFYDRPKTLSVTHPAVIPVGSFNLNVNVTTGGNPVAHALVAAVAKADTVIHRVAYTDASGNVTLAINSMAPDSLFITVTGRNLKVYEGCALIRSSGPYVGYLRSFTSDPAPGGNNNGQPNPGETVYLPVWVKNYGNAQANNVTGRLRLKAADPYITILDSSCTFGTILAGDSARSNPDFRYRIAGTCPDRHPVNFTLVCTGDSVWSSDFSQVVGAPILAFASVSIVDTIANGNRNRVFEPGETVLVYVQLGNSGSAAATSVVESLTTNSSYVSIVRGVANYGTINAGGNATSNPPYIMCASPTTPVPHFANVFETVNGTSYVNHRFLDTFQVTVGRTGWRDNVEDTMVTRQYTREALWHSTTRRANSPTHSWWCGNPATGQYENNMNASLTTPGFFIGSGDTALRFSTFYIMETNWDYGYVEASTDNGASWSQITRFNGSSGGWTWYNSRITYLPGTTLRLRFRFTSDGSVLYEGWFVDDINIFNGVDVAEELVERAQITTELFASRPNPFAKAVCLTYALPSERKVKVAVYDVTGQLVDVLVDQKMRAGQYSVVWTGVDRRGRKLPNGVYFTHVELGQWKTVKKIIMIR